MTDEKLIKIFLDLIRIEAVSAQEKSVAEYISVFLRNIGCKPVIDDSAINTGGNTGNLLCKIGNGGKFVLLSHMDTARSTLNVKPIIRDDKITSDGNTVLGVDNRAGIAVILYALETSIKSNIPLNDFTIAFTTQEETTLGGSRNLVLDENIKMGFVFDSHMRPGNFICESCGDAGFNINVIGKASHSGIAPEKGISSIKIAANAISEIEFGRINPETTANIGIINGGSAVNVVPELTKIEGEVRSMDLNTIVVKLDEIKEKFDKHAKQLGGKIEFTYQWDFKPYRIKPENEVYKKIVKTITAAGLTPKANVSWGGSDANSLNEKGIECVNLGIGAENPHSNDEFILLEDLQKSYNIALEIMKK